MFEKTHLIPDLPASLFWFAPYHNDIFSYELIAYNRFYFSPYSACSASIFRAGNHAKKGKIAFVALSISVLWPFNKFYVISVSVSYPNHTVPGKPPRQFTTT